MFNQKVHEQIKDAQTSLFQGTAVANLTTGVPTMNKSGLRQGNKSNACAQMNGMTRRPIQSSSSHYAAKL